MLLLRLDVAEDRAYSGRVFQFFDVIRVLLGLLIKRPLDLWEQRVVCFVDLGLKIIVDLAFLLHSLVVNLVHALPHRLTLSSIADAR